VFQRKSDELYRQWAATRPGTEIGDEEDPSDSATTTLEEAEELAWSEVEKYLRTMNPYDLQVAPPGPDKGIDILAHTDPLGTTHPRIKVQVKRQGESINVEGLRSFMAVLGEQDVGIFVSTGGFTSAAEQEARTQEKRKITLVDMEKLFDLWVQHYDRLNESDKRFLPLKPVYYIAATE
jgi:restriction system protein